MSNSTKRFYSKIGRLSRGPAELVFVVRKRTECTHCEGYQVNSALREYGHDGTGPYPYLILAQPAQLIVTVV